MARLLARRKARLAEAEAVVRPILEAVRTRGDKALLAYARRFDGLIARPCGAGGRSAEACAGLSPEFRERRGAAAANIRAFAEMQMPARIAARIRPGPELGQIVRPLDTMAAYIPSGRYPLPSTLMMTVIPAQVAGVPNICVASRSRCRKFWGRRACWA